MTRALAHINPPFRMASAQTASGVPEERELIQRAQRGDVRAFEALYRASSGRVFALCLRMLGDSSRATEALQDVFVRVWERLGQYNGDAAFSTWVHRVCVNQLLEQRRTDTRREARVLPVDLATHTAATTRESSRDADTRLDLERALPKLADGARRVFVLHDMEGYGNDEIAKLLGIAESTVRVQLHRARKQLMELMQR